MDRALQHLPQYLDILWALVAQLVRQHLEDPLVLSDLVVLLGLLALVDPEHLWDLLVLLDLPLRRYLWHLLVLVDQLVQYLLWLPYHLEHL